MGPQVMRLGMGRVGTVHRPGRVPHVLTAEAESGPLLRRAPVLSAARPMRAAIPGSR